MKYQDGRKNNGGARPGAGRPRSYPRRVIDSWIEEYVTEKIYVLERRGNQMRRVKKARLTLMLDKLYRKGIQGDTKCLAKYLEITLGKAKPPTKKEIRAMREAAKFLIHDFELSQLRKESPISP